MLCSLLLAISSISRFPKTVGREKGPARIRAAAIPFAASDVNDHALFNLQSTQLGSAHASGILGHEHRVIEEIVCAVDQARDFIGTQDGRQSFRAFRIGQIELSLRTP